MRHVLFLTSSARPKGNAATLAQVAAAGLPEGCGQQWIDLAALALPPFHDLRPAGQPPEGALQTVWQAMVAATDLVFVAPVYWYALPAPAKMLLDHWSGWLDVPGLGFADRMRGKTLWLITARADPDPTVPAPLEAMLRRSGQWLGLHWAGALHGIGDAPGEVLQDTEAMARARRFFHP